MSAATCPLGGAGITVVELAGRLSGRFAGSLLTSLGATVHRVVVDDWPGDEYPSAAGGDSACLVEIAFDSGKTVHRIRMAQAADLLGPLLAAADVLITSGENTTPDSGPLDRRHGLGFAGVQIDLTPFGNTGPYRSYRGADLNVTGFGGAAAYIGGADEAPIAPPFLMGAHQAGLLGAIGALAGVRLVAGSAPPNPLVAEPLVVDVAEYEALATTHVDGWYPLSFFSGPLPRRAGRRRPGPFLYTLLRCRDGDVAVGMNEDHQWRRLIEVMGTPAWSTEERFTDRRVISENYAQEWAALVEDWLANLTKDDIRRLAVKRQIPFGPVYTVADLLASSQLDARGFFRRHTGNGPEVLLPGLPFPVKSATGERVSDLVKPSVLAPPASLPLAGVRVLDLGRVIAGPVVGQFLGDLGADVVKIESRTRLDGARRGIPLIATDVDRGDAGELPNLMPYFNSANRGKRSMLLNLGLESGRQVFRAMLADTEVLVENFGPGGLEKLLGCPVEDLMAIRPGLVVVRISLYGQRGPDRSMIGYAPHTTAMGGLDAVCGYGPDRIVGMMGSNFGDLNAALFGVLGALTALRGGGGVIDLAMVEAHATHLAPEFVDYQRNGNLPVPTGNAHPVFEPHGMFRCAGDDEWVSVCARDDAERESLRRLLGETAPEASDAGAGRLGEALARWTAQRGATDAFHQLQAAGVAAAPVTGVEDLLIDPHATDRETVVNLEHHLMGIVPLAGCALRTEPPMMRARCRAPDLGEHTLEVLVERAFSPETIADAAAANAFDGQLHPQRLPS